MTIAGVDGTRGGWLAATLDGDRIDLMFVETLASLVDDRRLDLILVDVPIGLPDRGPRGADLEARRLLRDRHSSVFPAPIRPMLAAKTWNEACEIRFAIEGKRCSKQTFAIMDKIAEVDSLMMPALQERVIEAHPEVSFTLANRLVPMKERKASSGGRRQRIELLETVFPGVEALIQSQPRGRWLDCTDAVVCLWTATRVRDGRAERLPRRAIETDCRGLRMEILA
jgi:predicted RNase H-like nuclease